MKHRTWRNLSTKAPAWCTRCSLRKKVPILAGLSALHRYPCSRGDQHETTQNIRAPPCSLLLISTAGCGAKTTSPAPTEAPATASSAAAPSEPTPSSTSDADAQVETVSALEMLPAEETEPSTQVSEPLVSESVPSTSEHPEASQSPAPAERPAEHHRSNRNRSRRLRILLSRQPLCQQDRHRSLHSMWDIGWISPRPMPKASAWSWTVRP